MQYLSLLSVSRFCRPPDHDGIWIFSDWKYIAIVNTWTPNTWDPCNFSLGNGCLCVQRGVSFFKKNYCNSFTPLAFWGVLLFVLFLENYISWCTPLSKVVQMCFIQFALCFIQNASFIIFRHFRQSFCVQLWSRAAQLLLWHCTLIQSLKKMPLELIITWKLWLCHSGSPQCWLGITEETFPRVSWGALKQGGHHKLHLMLQNHWNSSWIQQQRENSLLIRQEERQSFILEFR